MIIFIKLNCFFFFLILLIQSQFVLSQDKNQDESSKCQKNNIEKEKSTLSEVFTKMNYDVINHSLEILSSHSTLIKFVYKTPIDRLYKRNIPHIKKIACRNMHASQISFAPDGKSFVATGIQGGAAIIITKQGGKMSLSHGKRVNNVAFFSDSSHFVTTAWDTSALIWDAKTGQQKRSLSGHSQNATFPLVSPLGNYILTSTYDGGLFLWQLNKSVSDRSNSIEKFTLLPVKEKSCQWNYDLKISSNGKKIILASPDGAVLFDADSKLKNHIFPQFTHAVGFSDDNNKVFLQKFSIFSEEKKSTHTYQEWDIESGNMLAEKSFPVSNLVAGVSIGIKDEEILKEISKYEMSLHPQRFSANGQLGVWMTDKKDLLLFSPKSGKILEVLEGSQGDRNSTYGISPDGLNVWANGLNQEKLFWIFPQGKIEKLNSSL